MFATLRRQCLHEVGIIVDDALKSDGIQKYDSWFQLAFRDGVVLKLQDQIFTMWENKEVKGQRHKKRKSRPTTGVEVHCSKKDRSHHRGGSGLHEANAMKIHAGYKRRETTCVRLV